jgi:hypothetical protein
MTLETSARLSVVLKMDWTVIPPKISGVQKPNFLGKISEEVFDEDSTI